MHPVSLPIQGYRGALFAPRRSDTKGIAPQSRAHRSAAYFIYAYYNSRYVSYKTSPPVRAIAQCCARIALTRGGANGELCCFQVCFSYTAFFRRC